MRYFPTTILLNIFRLYLGVTPRFWSTLPCVCQRWRRIVITSPLSLNIGFYCMPGKPVLETLDYWPDVPIIVRYGGVPNCEPPAPEENDNIIAALKQSGRVSSISLTVTSSLFEKFPAISEPFSELEDLTLLSRDIMQLALPSTFRWGPRLRTLHSSRVAFPSFPQLLLPSRDLVDLELHEIPTVGYFSPVAFANVLSGMTQLQSLSLHFLSLPPRRKYFSLPPQVGQRVVLPNLTRLKYRGTGKYLDSLAARIDSPRLGRIEMIFFSQPTIDASQVGRFIERIETLTSSLLGQADIISSAHAISISFYNSTSSTPILLQISCKQLNWQLFCMAQVCHQFSPFLFRVNDLAIDIAQSSIEQDDVGGEHWQGLIRAFTGATEFRVAGGYLADLLCALRLADGRYTTDTAVLSSLCNLRLKTPMPMHGPSWDAVQSLVTSRWLSGHPIQIHAPEFPCHICDASFTGQKELKTHLVERHAYRIVCSYCGHFTWSPGYSRPLFREHLQINHPQVARNDPFISNPLLTDLSFQHDSLVDWHGSLLAPDLSRSTRSRRRTRNS